MASRRQPSNLRGMGYDSYLENSVDLERCGRRTACAPFQGITLNTGTTPTYGLGDLDALPIELICEILFNVDIKTMRLFHQTNRSAAMVLQSDPRLRRVMRHYSHVLAALSRTGVTSRISFNELFALLSTYECANCGRYGGYIYTITCTRVCFNCFKRDVKYKPMIMSQVEAQYALDQDTIKQFPRIRSVPGRYGPFGRQINGRFILYDRGHAQAAASRIYGSFRRVIQAVILRYRRKRILWVARNLLESPPPPADQAPIYCFDEPDTMDKLCRSMAVVRADTLLHPRLEPVEGFVCLGCARDRGRPEHKATRMYTPMDFDAHIEQDGPLVRRTVMQNPARGQIWEHQPPTTGDDG